MSEEESTMMVSWPPLIALSIVVGASIAGVVGGAPLVFIFLSASALTLTIALLWSSLGRMGQGARLNFEDALELAAPTATEEQKLAVLRALKDLEYELSVGKISKEDFDAASADYRAQARRLIAAQDESMKEQLEAAEALVSQHLSDSDPEPQRTKAKKVKSSGGKSRSKKAKSSASTRDEGDSTSDEETDAVENDTAEASDSEPSSEPKKTKEAPENNTSNAPKAGDDSDESPSSEKSESAPL